VWGLSGFENHLKAEILPCEGDFRELVESIRFFQQFDFIEDTSLLFSSQQVLDKMPLSLS
jgi:hypothetical protein